MSRKDRKIYLLISVRLFQKNKIEVSNKAENLVINPLKLKTTQETQSVSSFLS
jgi:hypothetical protein